MKKILSTLIFVIVGVAGFLSSPSITLAQSCADLGGLCRTSIGQTYNCCPPLECNVALPGGEYECGQPPDCQTTGELCRTSTAIYTCCYPNACDTILPDGDIECGSNPTLQCRDVGEICRTSTTSYSCCTPNLCNVLLPDGDYECGAPTCVAEGDFCTDSSQCCSYPTPLSCLWIGEDQICLPSDLECGNQGEPCCPTGDECYGEDVECTINPIDGERVCMASYAKECSDAHCDGEWGYCGVGDFDSTYLGWGCTNSTYDCNSESRESCADCWCCPSFHFPYSAGESPEDDYCSIPTIPPAATIVPRAGLPVQGDCPVGSIDTAVGCLPVSDKNAFLSFILRWAIGIAGGVSFILIASSGFMIITAAGDKRKLQGGKELLTAAVSGLMLIIFSVFILDLIGIRILRIPGL